MTETDLMNLIKLELSKHGLCFRINVGKIKMQDGRYFDVGLPRGWSDLMFIKDGRVSFIEVKTPEEHGKLIRRSCRGTSTKHDNEQRNFIKQMQLNGCEAGFASTVEQACEICQVLS